MKKERPGFGQEAPAACPSRMDLMHGGAAAGGFQGVSR